MSLRKIVTTVAVVAAFLALPVVASARISDVGPLDVKPKAQQSVVAPASAPTVVHDDGGTGTATVLVIAGLALLGGAASGFEGRRIMQRRGRALQA